MSAQISAFAHALPESEFTNDDLVRDGIDTSDEWVVERTGIKSRRIASSDQKTSDFAIIAAQNALDQAGLTATDIDLIILATTTPDHPGFPSTACIIQSRLGIPNCPAFDLSAACTGFNYALTIAEQFITTKKAKNALVIAADCLSKIMDWSDRTTCVLFGDGAGACIVSPNKDNKITYSEISSDGTLADILKVEKATRTDFHNKTQAHEPVIKMKGKSVFKTAIELLVPKITDAIQNAGLTIEDIDHFILHQANTRILDKVAQKIGIPSEKMISNLDRFGNTSAASIPIATSEAISLGRIQKGDTLMMVGFGGGFTWGINIIRW